MAELASGAVSSLLGLLRNEALLLSTVGSDMEFIKEEMESMQSFLEHLARTACPASGHDEQVCTWIKQVRDLARDCSDFIELRHRRGDLVVYRASPRWRYLWWADRLVHKMGAEHSAATRLRELKERACDVGKRRLRYSVEIPRKDAAGWPAEAVLLPPPPPWSAAEEEDDDYDEEEDKAAEVAAATDGSDPHPRALLEESRPQVEDYSTERLASWLELQSKTKELAVASTAIVAPDDAENAGAIARESLNLATRHFKCKVWINLSDLHLPWDLPLQPSDILAYILRECEIQERQKQEKGKCKQQQQQEAYRYKQGLDNKNWDMICYEDIDAKIGNIRNKIGGVDSSIFKGSSKNLMRSMADKRLGVLLHVLRLLQGAGDTGLPPSRDEAMLETAFRLQTHMEQEAETKATSTTEHEVKDKPTSNMEQEVKAKPQICIDHSQYKDILKKVFQESNTPQPQVKEASTSTSSTATTLGEDHIKEIIHNHRITLDIIWKLLPKQQQQLEGSSGTGSIQQQEQEQDRHDQVANSTAAADAVIKQTREKMKDISTEAAKASGAVAIVINETKIKLSDIKWEITDQLRNKGVVDKINRHLKDKKTLIILQDDEDFLSHWEETRYALNLLGCAAGSAVIVSTKNSQKAKEFCNPPGEPVTCSLVGLYYDIVLQLTEQRVNNGNDGYNPQILCDILETCHHEFCMKIFVTPQNF